jgi:membrane protease YdiL (CAAX protease family)
MEIKSIFISPDEPRLRAGWRLLIQSIIFGLLLFCGAVPFSILAFIPDISLSFENLLFFEQIIELFAIGLSVFLARRFLDKRSFTSLGLKIKWQSGIDVLVGVGITFAIMVLIFWIEFSLGWLTLDGFAWQSEPLGKVIIKTLVPLITFVFVGWNEELHSRGYHLQTLASGLNIFWGVLLSSTIFGILHLGNPNANARWFVFSGIFLAGTFLAYGYIRTKQLWLPIGLHIGWNFFEGVVFGFPVSGMNTYRLIRTTVIGPELWTGGAFGPEAGLVLIPALMVGTLLIYLYTRNHSTSKLDPASFTN